MTTAVVEGDTVTTAIKMNYAGYWIENHLETIALPVKIIFSLLATMSLV